MLSISKIRFFFISVSFVALLTSCEKNKNDVLPDEYIDFTIDLFDFVNIYGVIGFDTVDANDLRINDRRYAGGIEGNGIIIFSGADGYYAYDRTCPYDYVEDGLFIKVKIDFTIATCPRCSTAYALAALGTPASGPGKYPLKNYKTSQEGRYLHVWNY
jgi:nitrite reductase/ring-hydroxylating ferredoxin subunit